MATSYAAWGGQSISAPRYIIRETKQIITGSEIQPGSATPVTLGQRIVGKQFLKVKYLNAALSAPLAPAWAEVTWEVEWKGGFSANTGGYIGATADPNIYFYAYNPKRCTLNAFDAVTKGKYVITDPEGGEFVVYYRPSPDYPPQISLNSFYQAVPNDNTPMFEVTMINAVFSQS